jgi:ATP-dependent DNA ligase
MDGCGTMPGMDLPVMPPVEPMLAKAVKEVPAPDAVDGGLAYEPKWDGFRCIVYRDGDEVELQGRGRKTLTRYFPELAQKLLDQLPPRCVVDGEIVVRVGAGGGQRLDWDALAQRIHPADSRVQKLARETPAEFVAFDLLADDSSWLERPFGDRRARLEELLADVSPCAGVHLTRVTGDPETARSWFEEFEGAGLDGVVAKPLDAPYVQNGRTMMKVKHERTADVVVAGYREHKTSTPEAPLLGSLLLGLYADGELQHVGVSASFTAARRAALIEELQPLVCPIEEHPWGKWQEFLTANPDRIPGTQSRWSAGKDLGFTPLRPERVLEVKYDHMEGRRFRHTAQFKRWRPDRDPRSCGYDQLEEPVGYDLARILSGGDHHE